MQGSPLWNLCTGFQLPPTGMDFIPEVLTNFSSASLPRGARIKEYAKEVLTMPDTLPVVGGLFQQASEIRFGVDSATVDSAGRALIVDVAGQVRQHLGRHPTATLHVIGYADLDDAGKTYNEDLAGQRARAVAAEFVRAGIDYNRVEVDSSTAPPGQGTTITTSEAVAGRGATVHVEMPRIATPPGILRPAVGMGVSADASVASGVASAASASPADPFELSLASVAVQLTDVLVDRAGEQVQVYVVRLLDDRLCEAPEKSGVKLSDYLRRTCTQLGHDTDWLAATAGRDLRLALASDFREMPERFALMALQSRSKVSGVSASYRDAANAAATVLAFVHRIENGEDPLQVIAGFTAGTITTPWGSQWALSRPAGGETMPLTDGLLRFARFAQDLQRTRTVLGPYATTEWATADTVFAYSVRTAAVMLADPVRFPHEDEIRAALGTEFNGVDDLLASYRGISETFQRVRGLLVRLDTLSLGGTEGHELRRQLYGRLTGLISDIGPSLFLPEPGQEQQLRPLLQPVQRMLVSVRTQNYGEALPAVLDLLRVTADLLPDDQRSRFSDLIGGEQQAIRVLSLASSISNAQSEQQVNQTLREFVGQGRDFISKREVGDNWRVSLNAYVGGVLGREVLEEAPAIDKRSAGYFSISVPIGVEIGRSCGGGRSCSMYFPLVDLGAIAATRFDGDDVESTPDVSLETIMTPGAYFLVGLANVPISAGVGVNYAPESRARKDGTTLPAGAERQLNAFRFGFFIGVDIPLFP